MSKDSVVVEHVSKKFSRSLKDSLSYGLVDSCRRLLGKSKNPVLRQGEFWALQDINFRLTQGDALGIMGVNGSGKTTLLRILNGTYSPDEGKVSFKGKMGALIAAGAGFSPMLSGRENIYISAALLGMSPIEIRSKFDEIVDFADLGKFIDMPIKNYSSGMSVRLGFAIAAIGNPQILLVDEVLAVGDISFQKKCYERIQQMRANGATILLVSHAPGAIWSVCNKALVIHHGRSSGVMHVEDACREYENNNLLNMQIEGGSSNGAGLAVLPSEYGGAKGGVGSIVIERLEVLDASGAGIQILNYGDSFKLRFHINAREPVKQGILRVQIDSEIHKALSIIDSYEINKEFLEFTIGQQVYEINVKRPNLRPGIYSFCGSIIQKEVDIHLFFEYNLAKLAILHSHDNFFYADFRAATHLEADCFKYEKK